MAVEDTLGTHKVWQVAAAADQQRPAWQHAALDVAMSRMHSDRKLQLKGLSCPTCSTSASCASITRLTCSKSTRAGGRAGRVKGQAQHWMQRGTLGMHGSRHASGISSCCMASATAMLSLTGPQRQSCRPLATQVPATARLYAAREDDQQPHQASTHRLLAGLLHLPRQQQLVQDEVGLQSLLKGIHEKQHMPIWADH